MFIVRGLLYIHSRVVSQYEHKFHTWQEAKDQAIKLEGENPKMIICLEYEAKDNYNLIDSYLTARSSMNH